MSHLVDVSPETAAYENAERAAKSAEAAHVVAMKASMAGAGGVDAYLRVVREAEANLSRAKSSLRAAADALAKVVKVSGTDELAKADLSGDVVAALARDLDIIERLDGNAEAPEAKLDGLIKSAPLGSELSRDLIDLRMLLRNAAPAKRAEMLTLIDKMAGEVDESKKARQDLGLGWNPAYVSMGSDSQAYAFTLRSREVAARQDLSKAIAAGKTGEELQPFYEACRAAEDAIKGQVREPVSRVGLSDDSTAVRITIGGTAVTTHGAEHPHIARMTKAATLRHAQDELVPLKNAADQLQHAADIARGRDCRRAFEQEAAAGAQDLADNARRRYDAQLVVVEEAKRAAGKS